MMVIGQNRVNGFQLNNTPNHTTFFKSLQHNPTPPLKLFFTIKTSTFFSVFVFCFFLPTPTPYTLFLSQKEIGNNKKMIFFPFVLMLYMDIKLLCFIQLPVEWKYILVFCEAFFFNLTHFFLKLIYGNQKHAYLELSFL